ncbi:NAD(P)H-dependent oxidoreductase [Paenibacillus campi]|uniref:NAD(P)H-dependent oxidoreductase n=1 Tax=Paenibacillus campi TaxID=3106031 RepID=UPI002B00057F|nr:NAD(P)H-dependent oxidoreductase [Paenibacillus sp. SGZ-1014]
MNILLIYTHPNHNSLCHAMLEQVQHGLGAHVHHNRIETKTIDLYAEGFHPALLFNEHKRRRDMHRDPELELYRERVRWADQLVFIYPIWWGRPPAMLLGFFDRMMASGFAYRHRKPYDLLPEGLLQGKSVVCISTMKGPSGYLQLWLGNAHRILMRRALFNYIGIRKVKFWEFGGMEQAHGKQRQKLERVYRYFRDLRLVSENNITLNGAESEASAGAKQSLG